MFDNLKETVFRENLCSILSIIILDKVISKKMKMTYKMINNFYYIIGVIKKNKYQLVYFFSSILPENIITEYEQKSPKLNEIICLYQKRFDKSIIYMNSIYF